MDLETAKAVLLPIHGVLGGIAIVLAASIAFACFVAFGALVVLGGEFIGLVVVGIGGLGAPARHLTPPLPRAARG